ncbi:DNA primase [Streptomyces sp. AcH 505]|uniref:bifunctional DNA primase/polymerase n=1 Tax=Streptomyces sp. AcH 505 TaxID=352211 RepID=UPI000592225D|nr:DNA primase [Streptomyces sp. AcH 505]
MGFTIGGIREMRSGARRRSTECTAVAEYTGLWGWDVAPGVTAGGRVGGAGTDTAAEIPAGSTLAEVARAWSHAPGAAVLLPVGRTFDIIDVAQPAGSRALVRLERMGLPLGPVMATATGRAHFFVAPGACAELPELLYRMGWDDANLDLVAHGRGSFVTAPPTPGVRWLRPPCLDTAAEPPQARLVLGTLAYICHRSTEA